MLPKRASPSLLTVLALLGIAAGLLVVPAISTGQAPGPGAPQDYLTFHNDAQRTGWYRAETTLTPAKVKAGFGLIGSLQVPGKVYAQPLYVTNQSTKDGKTHNLVIIATATDQLYAVDDKTDQAVWHRSFTGGSAQARQQSWSDFPGSGPCFDMSPDIGITGTPVVDRALERLFVVVATKETTGFHLRLHAISLKDGSDVANAGPTEVTDSATKPLVNALFNNQRAALLESKGNVYVALADHCDWNAQVTHGWLLSFSATTLQRTGNLNTTKHSTILGTYFLGSPWMAGFGPAADSGGNVYFTTGNGSFDGLTSFSMSVIKVPQNLDMTNASYFVPPTWLQDSANDDDLASGGVMLLPDQPGSLPHLLVMGGKCSGGGESGACMKYILDRDQLGYKAGQTPSPAGSPPATPAPVVWQADTGGPLRGGPAYFADASGKQFVYYGGGNPPKKFPPPARNLPNLSAYLLGGSPAPNLTPVATASYTPACLQCREGGSQPVVSSNGTQANTAIVWVIQTPTTHGYPLPASTDFLGRGGWLGPAIPLSLWAFDAESMATLFHGQAASGTWAFAPTPGGTPFPGQWQGAAMVSPLVANGKVYVPLQDAVAIFGLKASPSASPAPPVILPAPAANFATRAVLHNAAPGATQQSVEGTITQVTGSAFVLRTLDGRTVRVDGSAAAKTGSTVRLVVGVRVYCSGRAGSNGIFHAVAIQYLRG